jgi:hypothetical protein
MEEKMHLIEEQYERWLRRHVVPADPVLGRYTRLVLRRLDFDRRPGEALLELPARVTEVEVGWLENLIEVIGHVARRDATARNQGDQRYAIHVHYFGSERTHRKIFWVPPDEVHIADRDGVLYSQEPDQGVEGRAGEDR